MGAEVAIAAAALVVSAVGTYTSIEAQNKQKKMAKEAANQRKEQAERASRAAALENQIQLRARLARRRATGANRDVSAFGTSIGGGLIDTQQTGDFSAGMADSASVAQMNKMGAQAAILTGESAMTEAQIASSRANANIFGSIVDFANTTGNAALTIYDNSSPNEPTINPGDSPLLDIPPSSAVG